MQEEWQILFAPEIEKWYSRLTPVQREDTDVALQRLKTRGNQLSMPFSRALGQKLFELRFPCGDVDQRITYSFDIGQRVILLTTFRKQRDNESREIKRARTALRRRDQ